MNQIAGTVSFRDMNSVERRRLWEKCLKTKMYNLDSCTEMNYPIASYWDSASDFPNLNEASFGV